MDGKSFLPMVLSELELPKAPQSVQRYATAHPVASTVSNWRDTHFIEYYYIGIGGYCGMNEPIEQPDNNFIALRKVSAGENMLYAEFQNGTDGNVDFQSPMHYELFDMDADPWQMHNIYSEANSSFKASLHEEVHKWLACKEDSCP